MKIFNEGLNTYPLFAHAQGKTHKTKDWGDIVATKPLVKKLFDTGRVTIVTFMSGDLLFCLPEQLKSSNILFTNAVSEDIGYWANKMKIKLLADIAGKIKTDYILCLDASDILCAEDLSGLVEQFESMDADIVYNGSKVNYPAIQDLAEQTDSCFKYLNAGAFIGKTGAVEKFYQFLVQTELYRAYSTFALGEQIRVRIGRKRYADNEKIKVDTGCVIFQTLNQAQFCFADNVLTVKNESFN